MAKEERKIGLKNGTFYPCPEKHVCVSTQSSPDNKRHFIEPISYEGSKQEAKEKILDIVKSMKRTEIVDQGENYIHCTFTSMIFRFVDDVEFLIDDNSKLIHFKSQSRIGGYDWNANRKRMEKIRTLYHS
ncbi:MAG: DUF1499 domain-containing protein [Candidatus Lokiarchaeota archaeon]|nr:DUF1499 domain-containing protein [Candidatus Lokiarchaeota archaeon]MBD3342830.1 DUF1499 domain-containing protein [Candidatus Lokiarchaeota archaeon]